MSTPPVYTSCWCVSRNNTNSLPRFHEIKLASGGLSPRPPPPQPPNQFSEIIGHPWDIHPAKAQKVKSVHVRGQEGAKIHMRHIKAGVAVLEGKIAAMTDRIVTLTDGEKTEVKKTDSAGDKILEWTKVHSGYVIEACKLCTCILL